MTRLFLLASIVALPMIQPAAAQVLQPGCNPAVQNWQNGSGDTCPYASNTALLIQVPDSPAPPPPVEEPVEEETVE
jgi:hypothetical protein